MDQVLVPNVRRTVGSGRADVRAASYLLRIEPHEIIRVLRAELAATGGAPELYIDAYSDFLIEEDYDRAAYGMRGDNRHDLVTSEAVLSIEPRLEKNYWVLSIVAHRTLGPQIIGDENSYIGAPISLDEFEARFIAADPGRVIVRLATETPLAKSHFDTWWADIAARHPLEPVAGQKRARQTADVAKAPRRAASAGAKAEERWKYTVREAVAVFTDPAAWEAAVTDLEMSGFDRSGISVLGSGDAIKARLGHHYQSIAQVEDDAEAPRSAFISRDSRIEGEAAAVGFPFFVAGLAGAVAVVASGGALAAAIAATILAGVGAAGIGGVLAQTIARRHRQWVEEQLALGGLVLWVSVPDARTEARALEVLRRHGGKDLHVHESMLEWGPRERPLARAQVDPFLLERDPVG